MLSGIKLVNMVGPGEIRSCILASSGLNLRCYAIVSGGETRVVLVNQEQVHNAEVEITLPELISSVHLLEMTAPSLTETDGSTVKIQGSSIGNTGMFLPEPLKSLSIGETRHISVNVPAHSVVVAMVR
jgi:hypothetical protein